MSKSQMADLARRMERYPETLMEIAGWEAPRDPLRTGSYEWELIIEALRAASQ